MSPQTKAERVSVSSLSEPCRVCPCLWPVPKGECDHRTFSQGLQVKFRRITGPERSLPSGNYTAVQVPQTQERHVHQPPFSMETSRRRPRRRSVPAADSPLAPALRAARSSVATVKVAA